MGLSSLPALDDDDDDDGDDDGDDDTEMDVVVHVISSEMWSYFYHYVYFITHIFAAYCILLLLLLCYYNCRSVTLFTYHCFMQSILASSHQINSVSSTQPTLWPAYFVIPVHNTKHQRSFCYAFILICQAVFIVSLPGVNLFCKSMTVLITLVSL